MALLTQTSISLQEWDRRLTSKEALFKERKKVAEDLNSEILLLKGEKLLLGLVDQTLSVLSSKLLGKSIKVIDRLITTGLRITFDDQQLEFKTSVERMRGKTTVKFDLLQDGVSRPIKDSYGGGVLVVTGILLRIITIIALGYRRVLFIDESLSHLSSAYIPNASKLMKKLCKELNFEILMVTHQPEFASEADLHYEAKPTADGTEFKLLTKGNKSVDNDAAELGKI